MILDAIDTAGTRSEVSLPDLCFFMTLLTEFSFIMLIHKTPLPKDIPRLCFHKLKLCTIQTEREAVLFSQIFLISAVKANA